jgi:hypothetical protein
MKRTQKFLAVFAIMICTLTSAAVGESQAAERQRRDRDWAGDNFGSVKIYADKNYQGRSQTLREGRYRVGDLRIGNDRLSSLRVGKGYQVILFQNDGFKGKQKVATDDLSWLGAFNDKTSSIIVKKISQPRPGIGVGKRPVQKSQPRSGPFAKHH